MEFKVGDRVKIKEGVYAGDMGEIKAIHPEPRPHLTIADVLCDHVRATRAFYVDGLELLSRAPDPEIKVGDEVTWYGKKGRTGEVIGFGKMESEPTANVQFDDGSLWWLLVTDLVVLRADASKPIGMSEEVSGPVDCKHCGEVSTHAAQAFSLGLCWACHEGRK
jgi:hypothetical protein